VTTGGTAGASGSRGARRVYRLHSGRYPANSGKGAAIHGGRWNLPGTEAIYTSGSASLAVLEVLAHYSILPKDFVLTSISIPDRISVSGPPVGSFPQDWNLPVPSNIPETQWLARLRMV
jgi:RES domain-containing protein